MSGQVTWRARFCDPLESSVYCYYRSPFTSWTIRVDDYSSGHIDLSEVTHVCYFKIDFKWLWYSDENNGVFLKVENVQGETSITNKGSICYILIKLLDICLICLGWSDLWWLRKWEAYQSRHTLPSIVKREWILYILQAMIDNGYKQMHIIER